MTSNGVVYGYDDSTLKPKEHISRVEALTILARCMEDAEDIEPVAIDALRINATAFLKFSLYINFQSCVYYEKRA